MERLSRRSEHALFLTGACSLSIEVVNFLTLLIVKGKKRAFNSTPDDFARELIKLFDEFALYRRTWPSAYDDVELMP